MTIRIAPVTMSIVWVNTLIHLVLHILMPLFYPQDLLIKLYKVLALVPEEFWSGSVWQPLTSMFLHGGPDSSLFGVIHLTVNMLALWSLGVPIERTIGSLRFALLYFVSGATSALLILTVDYSSSAPTVGASGAVLGILGALAIFYPNAQLLLFFIPVRARTAAVMFGLFSIVSEMLSLFSGVSHLGHLGGLVGGYLYSRFVLQLGQHGGRLHGVAQRETSRTPEEELMEMMRRIQGGSHPADLFRQEKDVTPPDTLNQDAKSVTESIKEEKLREEREEDKSRYHPPESDVSPMPEGEGGGKKLHFDPITGRFYLKE